MVLGTEVALFDIDPVAIGQVCCRFLGVSASRILSYEDCKKILDQLIPEKAKEDFDVKGALMALKIEVGSSIDVKTLIKRIVLAREKFISVTDRLLCGHTSTVVDVTFLTSSNLIVSTDLDGELVLRNLTPNSVSSNQKC